MKLLKINYYIIIHHGKKIPRKQLLFIKCFFKDAKKVIAVSEDIKKNYDLAFNITSEVIYPLVPFNREASSKSALRLQYNIPQDRNVICMVGSLKEMKNPDLLIEFLKNLSSDDFIKYNPHIVFAGDGPQMSYLQDLSIKYDVQDRISFLGFIPKDKVSEIFKMSDLYVIASDYEGTSVSLLEAMFNQLPIIASNSPGINKTVTDRKECLMFEVNNVFQFKSCVFELFSDASVRSFIANNAFKRYNLEFNYEFIVDSYVNILSK